jgi:hypothetical protein
LNAYPPPPTVPLPVPPPPLVPEPPLLVPEPPAVLPEPPLLLPEPPLEPPPLEPAPLEPAPLELLPLPLPLGKVPDPPPLLATGADDPTEGELGAGDDGAGEAATVGAALPDVVAALPDVPACVTLPDEATADVLLVDVRAAVAAPALAWRAR